MAQGMVRLAAVGDLHCTRRSEGAYTSLFHRISDEADVALLCGDLTDYGLPEEAQILAHEIQAGLSIPSVAVLGNHDHESGKQEKVRQILLNAGVMVLDGDACEVKGIGFAGVKGFCGGFGKHSVEAWGEQILKQFVQATINEQMRLDKALARLASPVKVVLLHYAPIEETVRGEPPEIYPFLGSRRLEEGLARHHITAVFHGHAHHGSPEGRLANGTPVYNVAMPLLRRLAQPPGPFRLLEVPLPEEEELALGDGGYQYEHAVVSETSVAERI